MLKEIKLIQGIGRFETAKPTHGATFDRCTLIFGENGWGKSTLADILRSLTTNDPAILAGRRTLASDAPAKVVLRFSTQNAIFENGAWTGVRPRIVVYDSVFINENVFSGDTVSTDHLKKQHELVVGEEGVRLIRRLVELDAQNRENNDAIKAVESELEAVIRTLGLAPAMRPDAFLALEARSDIDAAIAAKDNEAQRARRAKELKAAAEPSLLPVSTETAKMRGLLAQSIDAIAEAALASVRAHIAAHECNPKSGGLPHESWLEAGMAFVQGDSCPFCGQRLADRSLVDAYKAFFSEAYKTVGESVRKARDTLARYRAGDFRQTVSRLAEQNAGHFRYWQEAAKLDPPVIDDPKTLIAQVEEAAARLDALLARKQANLTEAICGPEANQALAAWDAGQAEIGAINAKIKLLLAAIKKLKDSIDPATLPELEDELKLLQATKRRHEQDIVALAQRLSGCQSKREAITKEKAAVRKELDEHGRAITTDLGAAINEYLRRLAAGFRIDYREPDYRTKEPSANYNILIREVAVSPRSGAGELDKPSFRNTLSAGDKSTLALGLFLAKANADPKISETIIVLDDPFTSLDHFRRQCTAIEIKKLCGRALQVIVLSHEKRFLRLLWDKIDHTMISSLALQAGAPGITTIARHDIVAETQPRHITERAKIEEFLEGEPLAPAYIRTRLRTVCEDFYRRGDPELFGQAASLEEIIRILDKKAPDTHPYKGALETLRDINEYSRGHSHAAVHGDPAEETSIEELKEFCRRVLDLTRGM
ncbi:AAA family ATPase [Verrucomicrobium sp. 3C]|uniref:AAA family ATPase n=1 Tax=Verrucomicrobium sp. 3C TaxID=1134055 RepID=UPI00037B1B9C|nr:AAA family ATPase [Verrucomicrobium sp. 3C]